MEKWKDTRGTLLKSPSNNGRLRKIVRQEKRSRKSLKTAIGKKHKKTKNTRMHNTHMQNGACVLRRSFWSNKRRRGMKSMLKEWKKKQRHVWKHKRERRARMNIFNGLLKKGSKMIYKLILKARPRVHLIGWRMPQSKEQRVKSISARNLCRKQESPGLASNRRSGSKSRRRKALHPRNHRGQRPGN